MLNELRYQFIQHPSPVRKLIAINVGIFIVLSMLRIFANLFNVINLSDYLVNNLALPATFGRLVLKPWTILTYMFLHQGFFHLLFNMLWLYWLGELFFEYLGKQKLYQVYVLGGLAGAFIYLIAFETLPLFQPVKENAIALGASAGVLGIVVATATLLPNYEVKLLLFGFVKLKWLAFGVVVVDFLSLSGNQAGGHLAHLGGALAGYLFIKQISSNTWFDKPLKTITNLFKPKPKLKVHHHAKTNGPYNQDEVDLILEKISKSGYDSLNSREKEVLFKASKN